MSECYIAPGFCDSNIYIFPMSHHTIIASSPNGDKAELLERLQQDWRDQGLSFYYVPYSGVEMPGDIDKMFFSITDIPWLIMPPGVLVLDGIDQLFSAPNTSYERGAIMDVLKRKDCKIVFVIENINNVPTEIIDSCDTCICLPCDARTARRLVSCDAPAYSPSNHGLLWVKSPNRPVRGLWLNEDRT